MLTVDRVFGIAFLCVAAFLFAQTFQFPVIAWEVLGLAFWPRLLLGLIAVVALLLVFSRKDDNSAEIPFAGLTVAVVCFLAFALSIPRLGYFPATAVFLVCAPCAIARSLEIRRIVEGVVLAVVGCVAMYLIFERVLLIQFPAGVLQGGF